MTARRRVSAARIPVTASQVDGVRRATRDGVTYVVAPVVLVRAKVLNGVLMTPDALERSVAAAAGTEAVVGPGGLTNLWERLPVSLFHPPEAIIDDLEAQLDWLEKHRHGDVRNARFERGAIIGEVWLPLEQADARAADAVKQIERGETMDVSIGAEQLVIRQSGEFGKQRYDGVVVELAPNHLALLPGGRGACSQDDGCGVPRSRVEPLAAVLSKARRPKFSGTSTRSWGDVDKSLAAFIRGANKDLDADVSTSTSVGDLPAGHRRNIAAKTLLGDPAAESLRDLIFFPVIEPTTGRLNRNALFAVKGGRGAQADISDAAKRSARAMADRLLASEFGVELQEQKEQKSLAASSRVERRSEYCGKRLSAVLRQMIDERSDEEGTEEEIVARVARATDLPDARVRRVLEGEEQFVPADVIEAFAIVMEFSPGVLFAAASSDIDEFMRTVDDEASDRGTGDEVVGPRFLSAIKETMKNTLAACGLGGKTMERKKTIDEIIRRNGWEVNSREVLEDAERFPDAALEAMLGRLPEEEPSSSSEGDQFGADGEPSTQGGDQPADKPLAAADVRSLVAEAVREETERREKSELVAQLAAIEERTGLKKAALEKLDVESLRDLHARHKDERRPFPNYVGGGGASEGGGEQSVVDRAVGIPVMYADADELRSASAAYSGRSKARPS